MKTEPKTAVEALRWARAAEAAKNSDLVFWMDGGTVATVDSWKTVNGKRVADRYTVDLGNWNCTCPDFQHRGMCCKHLIALDAHIEAVDADEMIDRMAEEYDAAKEADLYL